MNRTVIRFKDQWGYAIARDAVVKSSDMRIADYGDDGRGETPLYMVVDRLDNWGQYTKEQVARWKICGKTDLPTPSWG